MAEYVLTTEDGMTAWLQTLPEGQRRDAMCVLTSRCIVRTLPWVSDQWGDMPRTPDLPSLRASLAMCVMPSASSPALSAAKVNIAKSSYRVLCFPTLLGVSVEADISTAFKRVFSPDLGINFFLPNENTIAEYKRDSISLKEHGPQRTRHTELWRKGHAAANFAKSWQESNAAMRDHPADWSFWEAWYRDLLLGIQCPESLSEAVLTDASINWDDPVAANAKIVEIWKRHQAEAKPAKVSLNSVTVKAALDINKAPLGDQLDALAEMIAQEYERTRGRNPCNELEEQERARALGFFEKLNGSVVALSNAVAEHLPGEVDKTEEVVPLLGYYRDLFPGWPRANAPELVDSSSRIVLVAICAGVGGLAGAPIIGAMIGSAFFGAGKVQEAIAAVKSAGSGG